MELKIDFANKRTIAGVLILICILAGILYSPVILEHLKPGTCTIDGVCQHEEQLNLMYELIPVFILVGIIIGAVVFFFMTTKLDSKKKDLEVATNALVQFLNKDEKKVVTKLMQEKGKCLQSEITRLEGLGKVRSHRVLQKLVDRGVIEIEDHGKTNIIRFTKSISEALIK
jgi:uncharacterized membrane protein